MREVSTKINIILDGNSIPSAYGVDVISRLDTLYGAGNYFFTNICVPGQTIDNGLSNCMQARIQQFVINSIRGFSTVNILLFQEIRNEMFVNGSTPAQAVAKAVTYCNTVRSLVPSHVNLKIAHITPIADDDTGLNIDAARALILADTSGAWDHVTDLHGYFVSTTEKFTSDQSGATVKNTNILYNGGSFDGTHPNATGRTAAGVFVGNAIHTLYP